MVAGEAATAVDGVGVWYDGRVALDCPAGPAVVDKADFVGRNGTVPRPPPFTHGTAGDDQLRAEAATPCPSGDTVRAYQRC